MNRLESLLDSTRVTMSNSRHESESFLQTLEVSDKPCSFTHREMSIFASMMIKIGAIFLFKLCLLQRWSDR